MAVRTKKFTSEITKPAKFKPHPGFAYVIYVDGANGSGYLTKDGNLASNWKGNSVYGYPDEPHQFSQPDLVKEMKTLFERFLPGQVTITIVP